MSGLKYTLVVRNPEGGAVALLAGSEVPEWATDMVHPDDIEPAPDPVVPAEPEPERLEPEPVVVPVEPEPIVKRSK